MESREQLRGIVARGYCHEKNAHKELDGDLLEAIVDELLQAHHAQPDPLLREREAQSPGVKRPELRHPPVAIECRCDGNQVYALIGPNIQVGAAGFGDNLPEALIDLADALYREVGEIPAAPPDPLLGKTPEVNSRSQQKRIAAIKGEPAPSFLENPCEICGKDNIRQWLANNALWNMLAERARQLCSDCFDNLAKKRGIVLFWQAVISKHSLEENPLLSSYVPQDAPDPLLTELEKLVEKATPGEWRQSSLTYLYLIADDEPDPICSMGEYNENGSVDGEFENWKANAALIVTSVNYVKQLLRQRRGAREI